MRLILFLMGAASAVAQMSSSQLEQASDGIATAVEEQTATGQVIESVPQPFTVPGQAKPSGDPEPKAKVFERADKDRDGKMSYEEFALIIEEEKFRAYDADGDGFLSKDEAKAAAEQISAQSASSDAAKKLISIPFREIDVDGDGRLSKDEVLEAVKKQPQVQTIFNGIGAAPGMETGGRPDGVSLDQWNNYENVGGGVPLLRFSF